MSMNASCGRPSLLYVRREPHLGSVACSRMGLSMSVHCCAAASSAAPVSSINMNKSRLTVASFLFRVLSRCRRTAVSLPPLFPSVSSTVVARSMAMRVWREVGYAFEYRTRCYVSPCMEYSAVFVDAFHVYAQLFKGVCRVCGRMSDSSSRPSSGSRASPLEYHGRPKVGASHHYRIPRRT